MNKPKSFHNLETIGGLLLFGAAILAMIVANSPFREIYSNFLDVPADVTVGEFAINKPLHLWINDGLMAIYFLLVGLEIKREIKRGILSNKTSIIVPAITALCGLILPALIFSYLNFNNMVYLRGWAIPTATDIAFTLGVISLLKSRIPFSLKILLTAIAIFDDIGAIVIIAIFYTQKLSMGSLLIASICTVLLIGFNLFKVKRTSLFIVIGVALWAAVLKSGVHATLAGIVIAMTIPDEGSDSMLSRIENGIHPWVVFFILPAFAFANAGVTFLGLDISLLTHPIVLGVALGLFIGKQTGIFIPLWYFVKKKRYLSADNVNLRQIYGIALICGVGFTMSLFIGALAYQHNGTELMSFVKIGVVLGSLLSAVCGCLVLLSCPKGDFSMTMSSDQDI